MDPPSNTTNVVNEQNEADNKSAEQITEEPALLNSNGHMDPISEADSLIVKGKKELNMGLFNNACSSFATACENYSKVFGDLGKECIYPYFCYATALLELGRSESDIVVSESQLRTKLKGELDSTEDEEENGCDKDEKNFSDDVKMEEIKETNKENSSKEMEVESENQEDTSKENTTADTQDNCEDAGIENEDDEESNLRYADTILNLTIQVCERYVDEDDDTKILLSDAYLKKAEVLQELDEFETALHYGQEALKLQDAIQVPQHRMTAEIWCHLGMIFLNMEKYKEASTSYKKCLEFLNKRLEEISSPDCTIEKDLVDSEKDEITELIDELRKKLVDIQMSADTTLNEMIARAKEEMKIKGRDIPQDVTNITSKLKKRPLLASDDDSIARNKLAKLMTDDESSNSNVQQENLSSDSNKA